MALQKSISGIRGTIGGIPKDNLTPIDIVSFASAYVQLLKSKYSKAVLSIAVGRDGRLSGDMVMSMVTQTLIALGVDVYHLDYSTTPTIEYFVKQRNIDGGIMISASHNPEDWNALKLLNHQGEFLDKQDSEKLLQLSENDDIKYAKTKHLGKVISEKHAIDEHVKSVLDYPLVDTNRIRKNNFKVVVDVINSTGAISVIPLLKALNCKYEVINSDMSIAFAHNPEPLAQNLKGLIAKVLAEKADFGIAVDPDVDRLCFIDENGEMFGEEYTLIAIADYVLSQRKGAVVNNMSSSLAIRDIANKYGVQHYSAEVGEVNVVRTMKENKAVIGGEGNGGIIVPDYHYGRDALIGIGLFLTGFSLSTFDTISRYRQSFPSYNMVKEKMNIDTKYSIDDIINMMSKKYSHLQQDNRDGLKIFFSEKSWVHIRGSNTEPIIRIYAEAKTEQTAIDMVKEIRASI